MLRRMIGVGRLDRHTFEEVEHDDSVTSQALLVVIIVSISAAIGGLLAADNLFEGLIFGLIRGLAGWALWALVTYWVGTTLLNTQKTHANWVQFARTTGFAQTPGILQVFAFFPVIGGLVVLTAAIWQLVAMIKAMRTTLKDESTLRVVCVVVIGFILVIIPLIVIGWLFVGVGP